MSFKMKSKYYVVSVSVTGVVPIYTIPNEK
jgi:hypothetical protein